MSKKPIVFEVDMRGCHVCTSHRPDDKGYPMTYNSQGVHIKLAKYVWQQHHGEFPKGKVIRHLCNNRKCINVSHLSASTQKENLEDRKKFGTMTWGENNGGAKLKLWQVIKIMSMKDTKNSSTARMLAEEYGVSPGSIRKIWNGQKWGEVRS